MGWKDTFKKFGDKAQALGNEALEKGKVLGAEALIKGKALAEEGVAAGEKLTLKTQFAIALDDLATGKLDNVDPKLVALHQAALTDTSYATKFALYAEDLKAPKDSAPKTTSDGKVRDALDNGVAAVESALNEGAKNLQARKALVDLAIK